MGRAPAPQTRRWAPRLRLRPVRRERGGADRPRGNPAGRHPNGRRAGGAGVVVRQPPTDGQPLPARDPASLPRAAGATLCEWTADPHARVCYRVGRTWRTVHPDAVAELTVDGRRRWAYLEVNRGTAELRRYGLKLRRYARVYLSGTWRAPLRPVSRGPDRHRPPATGTAHAGEGRGCRAERWPG